MCVCVCKQPKALSLVSKTGSGGVVAGEADSPTPTSAEPQEPMDTGTPTSDQKGTYDHMSNSGLLKIMLGPWKSSLITCSIAGTYHENCPLSESCPFHIFTERCPLFRVPYFYRGVLYLEFHLSCRTSLARDNTHLFLSLYCDSG